MWIIALAHANFIWIKWFNSPYIQRLDKCERAKTQERLKCSISVYLFPLELQLHCASNALLRLYIDIGYGYVHKYVHMPNTVCNTIKHHPNNVNDDGVNDIALIEGKRFFNKLNTFFKVHAHCIQHQTYNTPNENL